jgi:hypothetical protein
MRLFVLTASFLLCSIVEARAQLSPYLCERELLPTVAIDSPVVFPGVTVAGTTLDTSGVLAILNNSEKGIRYYLVVMEFLDDQGKFLFSAPVYNADKDQHIPFDVAFKPWLLANWPGGQMAPIPARSRSDEGFATRLIALTCPSSVRISVIWVKYDDGKEFKYVSETLNLSATFQAQEIKIKKVGARKWGPITVTGTVEVDARGEPQIAELDPAIADLKTWLKNEFSRWGFTAAWAGGKPTTTRIPFVFILADNTDPREQAEALKKRGVEGPILLLEFQK